MSCSGCTDCPFDGKEIPNNLHEIHVTFALPEGQQAFTFEQQRKIERQILARTGAKLLTIYPEGIPAQHMLTKRVYGTDKEALDWANSIKSILRYYKLAIPRVKIETTPTNTEVISTYKDGYYESHIECVGPWKTTRESLLSCTKGGFHVSANPFKASVDTETYMMTHRSKSKNFAYVQELINSKVVEVELKEGIKVSRIIYEYCWYDSNIDLDKGWK